MSTVYPRYMKPINISIVQAQLLEQLDTYRNQQYMFNEIQPILEKFSGKKVTQRLITALEKTYPQFHFYLRWVGSTQCYLEVKWINEQNRHIYKGELSIFLGHIGAHSWAQHDNGQGFYTMDMISQNNVWLYQIDNMIQSTLNGMKKLKDNVNEWNSLLEKMQKIESDMESYHGLSTYFKFTN